MSHKAINPLGTYYYRDAKNRILHREDGPALITAGGSQKWFIDGKPHRVGAPAIIWFDGDQDWYLNGKLHRLDGPARQWDCSDSFYINGTQYLKREFPQAVAKYVTYIEVTKQDIQTLLGNYRITEW